MADRVLSALRRLNRLVAVLVGIMLLACAGVVLLDIVLRQAGSSLGGTDEISGYAMAIATSWGMGYALMELGHVRIDLLRSRAGARGRVLFDLFSMVVLSGTVSLIAVKCWPVLERSLSMSSRANTPLETPLWIVQLPWFAGWVWFALMAWLTFLVALTLVAQGRFAATERAIGAFAEKEAAP
ncbi:TRAP transporter small permease subunit [Rhodovulum sp. YNF3179]|uniref:TRAP transporter small permease subunit n=1 Tax=Rhodovulum sp. YNF3179 TaxID=3425127 RepID=UPI003D34B0C8